VSLSAKILTPFVALIACFALSTAYHAHLLSEPLARMSAVGDALSGLPKSFTDAAREARAAELALRRWRSRRGRGADRDLTRALSAVSARFSEAVARLEALRYPPRIERTQREARGQLVTLGRLEVSILQALREAESGTFLSATQLEERVDDLQRWAREARGLADELRLLTRDELRARQEVESEALWGSLLFLGVMVSVGVGATLYLAHLLSPLRALKEGVEAVGGGDYARRVPVRGEGELAQLAMALNRLAESVQERDARLESQQAERLHQARLATVGRLSAQITHELRNPLSSIGLNAELLRDDLEALGALGALGASQGGGRSPDIEGRLTGARQLLTEVEREVERLKGITEEYLRFARLPRPELTPIDLSALCLEVFDFCRAEQAAAKVSLQLDPDPHPRLALADPHHARSALLDLLRNAREALEPRGGGRVRVSIRAAGGALCVTVSDNGPGLSEEARARLFEPFFSTKPQGTGLGLAMVRQLMEAQGGRVEVGAGDGGVFELYFPCVDA
jgi:signal transduction histidine kinase